MIATGDSWWLTRAVGSSIYSVAAPLSQGVMPCPDLLFAWSFCC
jgi:hypothetical protein